MLLKREERTIQRQVKMGKFDSRLVILIFSTLTVILSGGGVAGGTPDKSRTAANRNEEMLKELGVEIKMKGKAIFIIVLVIKAQQSQKTRKSAVLYVACQAKQLSIFY